MSSLSSYIQICYLSLFFNRTSTVWVNARQVFYRVMPGIPTVRLGYVLCVAMVEKCPYMLPVHANGVCTDHLAIPALAPPHSLAFLCAVPKAGHPQEPGAAWIIYSSCPFSFVGWFIGLSVSYLQVCMEQQGFILYLGSQNCYILYLVTELWSVRSSRSLFPRPSDRPLLFGFLSVLLISVLQDVSSSFVCLFLEAALGPVVSPRKSFSLSGEQSVHWDLGAWYISGCSCALALRLSGQSWPEHLL